MLMNVLVLTSASTYAGIQREVTCAAVLQITHWDLTTLNVTLSEVQNKLIKRNDINPLAGTLQSSSAISDIGPNAAVGILAAVIVFLILFGVALLALRIRQSKKWTLQGYSKSIQSER